MGNEHQYDICSWQHVTTEVKKALRIKQLTKEDAYAMLRMYISGTCTEEIIKQMKGEKE